MHGVVHQRMRGIEQAFDLRLAVPLLALHDVVFGELQVVEDAVGVSPLLEQIIVLKEVVMAERRVRHHQGLHHGGILLHDVADAGVGVDDDFVCQPLHAGAVHCLVAREMLAERPVLVK